MLSVSSSVAVAVAFGAVLLVAVVPFVPVNGKLEIIMSMIPADILSSIPDDCRGNDDAELEMAVNCGVTNINDCTRLMSLIPEFGNIPSASEIENCDDINAPFCLFTEACETCSSDFEALVTCIVLKSEGLFNQNTTDFIDSCSLGCGNKTSVIDGIIDNILAPPL